MRAHWISVILRAAVVSLFAATSISDLVDGPAAVVASFEGIFKGSWLPMDLVRLHARIVSWAELALCLWLVAGIRLRWAWIATSFHCVLLGFGLVVARDHAGALGAYSYAAMCLAGLYFSPFDRFSLDAVLGRAARQRGSDSGGPWSERDRLPGVARDVA